MNKFTTLSTKKYTPLSYQEEYFHNKYELINSFMEDNLGDEFGDLLACPILKKEEVEWYSKFDSDFKRVSDFSKKEQDKILNIYWEKINKVIAFSQSFQSSKSAEKKKWAHLLDNVFNSDNNIIYSDGENVVLLWGWKFNSSTENYVPPPGISTAKVIEDNTIFNPIDEDPIPVIPIETKNNEPTILKLPWYVLFWNWIKRIFKIFWWILLLLFILWFLLNLDGCSCNKTEHIDVNSYNPPIGIQDTIYDNDRNNQPNNWNPENNNTGLEESALERRPGNSTRAGSAGAPTHTSPASDGGGKNRKGFADIIRGLNEFDQNAFAPDRGVRVALGMNEANIVARRSRSNPPRRKANALAPEPLHGGGEVVDPQAHVVEGRFVNLRTLIGIEGLHQIHLDFQRSAASLANILIDVFAFARVATDVAEPQGVHPKPPQPGLVQASHGDLL